MSRLLIICQKVDEQDDLLGFFPAWIRAFAERYDTVSVLALGVGKYTLPDSVTVYSLGKEHGASKIMQAWRMAHFLWKLTPRHGAVFCHMSPVFAILAWPFARMRSSKLVLWYLHRAHSLKLRCAVRLADTIVTADERSLSVHNAKIVAVGHGIDVARYAYPERSAPTGRPLRILSVGRLSPIKGFETLIRAAARLREREVACEVRIVGKAVMSGDHAYEAELHTLVRRLGVEDIVHFFGFVPHADMPAHYRWADVAVGCTPPGGIDKVLLEAMAAGCVPCTSNSVMGAHLDSDAAQCIYPLDDAASLADTIASMTEFSELSSRMVSYAGRHTVQSVVESIARYL